MNSVVTQTSTVGTLPPDRLVICMGVEPDTLYYYGGNMLAASNILEAIYDGPIDTNGFSYQPVILEKLPSLVDGDAIIQPVAVKENDFVVNDSGEVVMLRAGQKVRPYGCNLSDCAFIWQGEALEMAQMSATFTLKENIRWSDGKPLTADDSVFGFEKTSGCKDLSNPDLVCGTLRAGERRTNERTASYTALDERTIQWVGLPGYLDPSYMTNFAHPLPRHQLQGLTPEELFTAQESARSPMGWGPYIIDRWIYGDRITMHKNPYYFRLNEGLPHFDQLTFRFLGGDENSMVSAVLSGECDVLDQEAVQRISLVNLIGLGNSGQLKALISTGTTWEHLDFNIQPAESIINSGAFAGWDLDGDGQGPFGDVRLRQAIAMCLDRQQVVDTIFLGQSLVPDSYLPQNHPLFDTHAMHWPYDSVAGAALLDEIGWVEVDNNPATPRIARSVIGVPDGTPLSMNLESTTAPIRQQVYDILSQNLAGCGIQVNFKPYGTVDFFKADAGGRVYGRLYDLAEFSWNYATYPTCDLFISSQIPDEASNWSGSNNSGFNNPAYDAACDLQLQSLPGETGYTQAVMEPQRLFAEQLPVIPLFIQEIHAAARLDMCGYFLDPTSNSDFSNIEAFDYGVGCK